MDFILIHGGSHDGWCWSLLQEELRSRGHAAWAPDLPCDDVGAGVEDYAEHAIESSRTARDDAIVVGHSLGGLTAAVVAERRSCAGLVFLAAAVPDIGKSYREQRLESDGTPPSTRDQTFDGAGRLYFEPDAAIELFYHDCSPELALTAVGHLRPNGLRPFTEITPLKTWPKIPVSFIMGADDRCVTWAYERRVAHERFGRDVVEIPGGHSPFLSRPALLADVLLQTVAGRA